ncbi:MAG: ABC transporter ATP-binding protein [Rhodobacteraceae bacterium]|nr:MAG: ABC transporter ATP-binding protein [Paracoccaceae bacterium]
MAVRRGEILGIGGPNGAGKTTLFDVVTGVTPPTSGRILLNGREIGGLGADRICQMGVARTFQLNAAFDSLTILQNVEVAAYYGRGRRGTPGFFVGRETRARALEALETVGLTRGLDRIARDLPVLERKLLMIAGALATDPEIVLLDEPVGGLSPSEIDGVVGVVRRLAETGVTVVLIEHVMRFLLALSERVIIMHQGRTLYEGAPETVADDPRVIETYLGEGATKRLKTYFAEHADAAPLPHAEAPHA